jgi:periplasmic protein CpxP/Spy
VNSFSFKLLAATRRFVLLALVGCALSLTTHAQNENGNAPTPTPPPEQQRAGDGPMQLLPQLNLTDEQRTQLLAIAQQHNQELAAAQLRLRMARRALNQAIYAENPDQNLVAERTRAVAAAQAAIIQLNAQTELQVRQVLTPEQLRTFRRLRQQQRLERLRQRQLEGNNPRTGPNQSNNRQTAEPVTPPRTLRQQRQQQRQQRRQLPPANRLP